MLTLVFLVAAIAGVVALIRRVGTRRVGALVGDAVRQVRILAKAHRLRDLQEEMLQVAMDHRVPGLRRDFLPNALVFGWHPDDVARWATLAAPVATEVAEILANQASRRGFLVAGEITVEIVPDPTARPGRPTLKARTERDSARRDRVALSTVPIGAFAPPEEPGHEPGTAPLGASRDARRDAPGRAGFAEPLGASPAAPRRPAPAGRPGGVAASDAASWRSAAAAEETVSHPGPVADTVLVGAETVVLRSLLLQGPEGEDRVELVDGLTVGRDHDAGVRLAEPTVSKAHARFRVSGMAASVEDLGSANGTFVNGRRITAETPVRTGDVVAFGRSANVEVA